MLVKVRFIVLGVSAHARRNIVQLINIAESYQNHLDLIMYYSGLKNSLWQTLVQLYIL